MSHAHTLANMDDFGTEPTENEVLISVVDPTEINNSDNSDNNSGGELSACDQKNGTRRRRDHCHRFMTSLNTILLIAILAVLVGFCLYLRAELIPKLRDMEATSNKLSNTLDRINSLMDRVDQIPSVDWDFITSSFYQGKLITILQEIINYWPGLSVKLFSLLDTRELPPGMP